VAQGWATPGAVPVYAPPVAKRDKRAMPGPETWWVRFAASDLKVGAVFLVVGFVAVFLDQMSLLLQLVVGAPIFEEAFKFGLALVLVGALGVRPLAARLAVAWLIGAGFGVMEHYWGYSMETALGFGARVAFHGLSCGLSMLGYWALSWPQAHPATRWGSTILSAFIHYLNNFGAVVLGIGAAIAGASDAQAEVLGRSYQAVMLGLLLLGYLLVGLMPSVYQAVARVPVRFIARHV